MKTQAVSEDEIRQVLAAAKEGKQRSACLTTVGGPASGRIFGLGKQEKHSIGREDSDIVLPDPSVSRQHACIMRTGDGQFLLRDLGSTNGSYRNGSRITEAVLQDGDSIMIGQKNILRFSLVDNDIEDLLLTVSQRYSGLSESLQDELETARAIQAGQMPTRDLLNHARFSYSGTCETATAVGGDWWHQYPLANDRLLLCAGDVTGHGVPAALLVASAKTACDTTVAQQSEIRLDKLMTSLDVVIRQAGQGRLFMAFAGIIIDAVNMNLQYSCAGLPPPLVISKGHPTFLVRPGMLLGESWKFEVQTMPLYEGDLIALYSDGLTERESPSGRQYGKRRLCNAVTAGTSGGLTDLRDRIVEDVRAFGAGAPFQDDVTLVLCRVGS